MTPATFLSGSGGSGGIGTTATKDKAATAPSEAPAAGFEAAAAAASAQSIGGGLLGGGVLGSVVSRVFEAGGGGGGGVMAMISQAMATFRLIRELQQDLCACVFAALGVTALAPMVVSALARISGSEEGGGSSAGTCE
eukprot:CAMPEP_0171787514 /NCGR_PEP_ID=MMETSP0991-20121206/63950_1 /TAXON_ID=483369 /ORGANISM="non described non described, Strain CCMP2098" /LENGTH=137 /DNA_ID=CAMNT_0012396489 /DNA_START=117 /DNA_END=530 /DNA_ORIENTATION=-